MKNDAEILLSDAALVRALCPPGQCPYSIFIIIIFIIIIIIIIIIITLYAPIILLLVENKCN